VIFSAEVMSPTLIAYSSLQGTDNDIYLMNKDGSQQKKLTNLITENDIEPSWSPDGRKIAFTRYFYHGVPHIWIINIDGSNLKQLTSGTKSLQSDWSPDGKHIAFRKGNDLCIMNNDGSNEVTIMLDAVEPSWSPDGNRITFRSNWDIFTINQDGTNKVNLTNNKNHNMQPSWSPDGTKIAFAKRDIGLFVMNYDGLNEIQLTEYGGSNPSWSPDGTKIIFNSKDYCEIHVIHSSDGSNLQKLTNSEGENKYDKEPVWCPMDK
jgi:TolB protein